MGYTLSDLELNKLVSAVALKLATLHDEMARTSCDLGIALGRMEIESYEKLATKLNDMRMSDAKRVTLKH